MIKQFIEKILRIPGPEGKSYSTLPDQAKRPISGDIKENLQILHDVFKLCTDISFREFKLNSIPPVKAFIVFSDSLIKPEIINDSVLKSIMLDISESPNEMGKNKENLPDIILERFLTIFKAQKISEISEIVNLVLQDHLVLVVDGYATALAASAQGYNLRGIEEPTNEPNIRGPRDGFVENLGTNISLLRRRIRTSQMKIESITIGRLSQTKVVVCYIAGITNDKVVGEVKERLSKIDIDGVLDSGYVEEFICDEGLTLFPLVQYTERPDRTAAALLEGRIAIIVDNSPSILIVPCTFAALMQASEDYYYSALFASFARLGRFFAINIALLAPAITVAAFSVNQALIPISLLNTVAGARENLPLPISVEIFLMELVFELLREAGVRLPRTVGQAISTVGGLVIGQAAVNAGIVSPTSVVVVGLTAVASFTFPDYAVGTSIRILRFALILMASIMGVAGIIFGLMIILVHLCSLRSFGVPYLSPIAPLSLRDLKDTFVRAPWWAMATRPRFFGDKKPARRSIKSGGTKSKKGGKKNR